MSERPGRIFPRIFFRKKGLTAPPVFKRTPSRSKVVRQMGGLRKEQRPGEGYERLTPFFLLTSLNFRCVFDWRKGAAGRCAEAYLGRQQAGLPRCARRRLRLSPAQARGETLTARGFEPLFRNWFVLVFGKGRKKKRSKVRGFIPGIRVHSRGAWSGQGRGGQSIFRNLEGHGPRAIWRGFPGRWRPVLDLPFFERAEGLGWKVWQTVAGSRNRFGAGRGRVLGGFVDGKSGGGPGSILG